MSKSNFMSSGTRTDHGWIVQHDVTLFGLGRLYVEKSGSYPDVSIWLDVLQQRGFDVLLYDTQTRYQTGSGNVMCELRLYYRAVDQVVRITKWQEEK